MNPNFKTNRWLDEAIEHGELMWKQMKPAAREGLDPTLIRAYKLEEGVVKLAIPQNATIEFLQIEGAAGTYWDVQFNSIHIYCRDFEPKAGTMITVRAQMCVRTWEPVGAADRTDGKTCYRNYEPFVDAYHSDTPTTCELIVHDAKSKEYGIGTQFGRRHPDMMGDGGHYCHVSGNRERDYHFQFVMERKPSRKPVMAEALAKAGVSTDVPLHSGERLG